MKKLSTIAVAMSALFFVSVSAKAQNPSSRNMERRGQSNQNDQYNNNNDDNGQYNQRDQRVSSHRPRVTIVIGAGGRRGNDGYNDHRRYNDRRRYDRYNRYDRYDRYHGRRSHNSNW